MTQEKFAEQYSFDLRKDKIGGGSFGTVYKAYDNINDIEVAIKISEVKHVGNKEFSLLEEYKAVKNLPAHANIANYNKVYRFDSFQGVFDYAIMQYYPLGNLSQYLKNSTVSKAEREKLVLGILKGIAFLHEHKVVHRDLKPSNILVVDRKGKLIPKITDFGLSKQAGADAKGSRFTNSFAGGTLQYSSPEQIKGLPLKLNTDLWSFGAIAYEILTGNTLFETQSESTATAEWQKEITEMILHADVSHKFKTLAPNWQNAITACLQRDLTQRVQNTEALLAILNNESNYRAPEKENPKPNNDGTVLRPSQGTGKGKTPRPNQKTQPSPKSKKNKWLIPVAGIVILLAGFIGYQVFETFMSPKEIEPNIFKENNFYGYKIGDSVVISPKYVDAAIFKDGLAKVSDSQGIYFINVKGDSVKSISKEEQDQIDLDYSKSTAAYQNKDYKTCVALLKKGAKKWHKLSQGSLGGRYLEGKGVTQNHDSAFYWYTKAALKNVASSQTSLGFMYAQGNGVEKNIDKSLEWYLKASENGDTRAMFSASSIYFDGKLKSGANYTEGVKWLTKAAETDALAQFSLGSLHVFGQYGVEKNEEKAKFWFQKSCDNGNTNACNNLEELIKIETDNYSSIPKTDESANNDSSNDEVRGEPVRGKRRNRSLAVAEKNKAEAQKKYNKTISELEDLALEAFGNSNFDEARDLCLEIIKSRPNDVQALKCVGFSFAQLGANNQALAYFKRSAKLGDAESYFLMSNILYGQREFLQAKNAAKNACDLGHQGGCQNYKNIQL